MRNMTAQQTWHVLEGQASIGPLSDIDVLKGYFSGRYGADTLVWQAAGDATWRRLGDAFPLAELTPPPLPGMTTLGATYAPPTVATVATASETPTTTNWVTEPNYAWRRFFSKALDVLLSATLMFAVLGALLSANDGAYDALIALGNPIVANVLGVFLAIVPNAVFVGLSGRSLGKVIFGIKVIGEDGQPPGLPKGFRRELQLTIQGFGLGIPLVSLLTMFNSYSRLKSDGAAPWDKDNGLRVLYRKPSLTHYVLAAFGIAIWLLILALLNAATYND